jgi:transglutaminase-like putative cysteine protease
LSERWNPLRRWKAFLARHLNPAEDSGLYRVAVTVLVMYALVLTLHQLEWPSYWWMVVLLTPAASWMSYHRRYSPNLEIKIFLSVAMVGLLYWFLLRLASSMFDPRIPLAELLIWLQTLHAFDLPGKKDLRYTVLVALILMAMASVLTYSSYFAIFVLGFCALLLVVAAIDFWSDNRLPGTREASGSGGVEGDYSIDRVWLSRTLLLALPTALLSAALIFVFMPRFQGLTLRTMPFNWELQFSLARVSEGEIVNRQLPPGSNSQSGQPQRISGDTYFGFDAEVNLNARGSLSDQLVLKVRTSNWQYHRAVTFAEYHGGGWKSGLGEPRLRTVEEPPFYFPALDRVYRDRLTIYYAEIDLPNIIFTPQYPRTLYFPSAELYQVSSFARTLKEPKNDPAVLVAPFLLETGMVYSVLNRIPGVPPADLKNLPGLSPETPGYSLFQPYLQLPEQLPERVRAKAEELAGDRSGPWDKASRLCAYLQQNYTYNLDVPFYPEGVDTVDHFLFEAQEGYCEQFATALVVMARCQGLPARYVTGYLPGTYNPLSGFYEIRANDAHAWAEIFLPGAGWIVFDPVPGGQPNPGLGEPDSDRFLLESLIKYLGLPHWIRQLAPTVIRLSVGLGLLALLVGLWRGAPSRRRESAESALRPFLRQAEKLVGARQPGETVKNWAQRAGGAAPLRQLAEIYEQTFYQDQPLLDSHREELKRALSELRSLSRGNRSEEP